MQSDCTDFGATQQWFSEEYNWTTSMSPGLFAASSSWEEEPHFLEPSMMLQACMPDGPEQQYKSFVALEPGACDEMQELELPLPQEQCVRLDSPDFQNLL